jgi:anti-anti-sigma factor
MIEHPDRLDIDTEARDLDGARVAVVRVAGEVDLANAEELEAALFSEPCSGSEAIVLNLAKVPFMDSSGLRVLLVAVRDSGARVALVLGEGSPVERLLDYAGMSETMPIRATEDEAAQAAAQGVSR